MISKIRQSCKPEHSRCRGTATSGPCPGSHCPGRLLPHGYDRCLLYTFFQFVWKWISPRLYVNVQLFGRRRVERRRVRLCAAWCCLLGTGHLGRVRRTVEASKASAQATAADLESTRLLVQAELAQDYFQLRVLDGQKQLLDETVIAFQKSLELTKNRYAAGVASKGDVLLAETQLKITQAQAIDVGVLRAQLEACDRIARRQTCISLFYSCYSDATRSA